MLGLQRKGADALKSHPENEKLLLPVEVAGQTRTAWFVNEPGLYRLIFQSRRPDAEAFKTWVFNDVLPSIRKSGFFRSLPPDMPEDLVKLPAGRRDHVLLWIDIMKEVAASKNRLRTAKEISLRYDGERGFSARSIYTKLYKWEKANQDWHVLDRYASLYKLAL